MQVKIRLPSSVFLASSLLSKSPTLMYFHWKYSDKDLETSWRWLPGGPIMKIRRAMNIRSDLLTFNLLDLESFDNKIKGFVGSCDKELPD